MSDQFSAAFGSLLDAFPTETAVQGILYARDGRVLSADADSARGIISGRVRGSRGRIYQCIVKIEHGADGAAKVFGHCACPVGHNCKHAAALVAAAASGAAVPASQAMAAPATGDALPPEVERWLNIGHNLSRRQNVADSPYRLLYLLTEETEFGTRVACLKAVKARPLAGGGWGTPQPFNIRNQSRAVFVGPEDRRVLAMARAAEGLDDGVELDENIGPDLLRAAMDTGRAFYELPDPPPLRDAGPLAGRLSWQLREDARLHVTLECGRPGLRLLAMTPPWYLDLATGDCGPIDSGLPEAQAALLASAPPVPATAVEALHRRAKRLPLDTLPLPPAPNAKKIATERPVPCLLLQSQDFTPDATYWFQADESFDADIALLAFDYAGVSVHPENPDVTVARVDGGDLVEVERDMDAEGACYDALIDLGFEESFDFSSRDGLPLELDDDEAWVRFVAFEVPRLQREGWRIDMDDAFRFRVAEVGGWEMDISEVSAGGWLDVGLGIDVDGERVDLLPLLVAVIRAQPKRLSAQALAAADDDGKFTLPLPDGRIALLPAQRLKPILSTLVELYDSDRPLSDDGQLRLSRLQAAQLAELEQADPALGWRGGEQARDWGRKLRAFDGLKPVEPPAGLTAELRPYQRQGLDWLQFLRELDLGGVLADDMGLGKTVQTLAHLLVEKAAGRADRPSLVVAPTSLMFNWRREAKSFAPSLKVLLLHGPDRRKRLDAVPEHDLVLTTYPLLPRDGELLAQQPWHLLVLDEAQAIKNPRSKVAQAVRTLDARHRLCLTGTPLENHLGELWALIDFLMPGVLGDERRFRRLFRTPIERNGDQTRAEQLRRRLAPFLLRRTKEAVAADLPPKTEILREVPLAADQRDLYETLRLALHDKVRREVEQKGLSRSGIIILDALLKLRQVCCDPRLVALENAAKVKGSAKLELLLELLPELLDEGRRVLLFSQFTSMLTLIEQALGERDLHAGRDFVTLTGQTRDRAAPVDSFQSGRVPLFLISLKAGGSGLNLTAADTVIHYDPWWNPAAERQATDRAHRLGQDKPVFVYKLLTEGTVEQRVAELQARKQALADAMLAGGDAAGHSLSQDDLELLFAPIGD